MSDADHPTGRTGRYRSHHRHLRRCRQRRHGDVRDRAAGSGRNGPPASRRCWRRVILISLPSGPAWSQATPMPARITPGRLIAGPLRIRSMSRRNSTAGARPAAPDASDRRRRGARLSPDDRSDRRFGQCRIDRGACRCRFPPHRHSAIRRLQARPLARRRGDAAPARQRRCDTAVSRGAFAQLRAIPAGGVCKNEQRNKRGEAKSRRHEDDGWAHGVEQEPEQQRGERLRRPRRGAEQAGAFAVTVRAEDGERDRAARDGQKAIAGAVKNGEGCGRGRADDRENDRAEWMQQRRDPRRNQRMAPAATGRIRPDAPPPVPVRPAPRRQRPAAA